MYHALLMDYYKNPRNKGVLKDAHFVATMANPLCGDAVTIYGYVQGNRVITLSFEGSGCIINQATASLLTEKLQGKSFDEIIHLNDEIVLSWIGLQLGPTRKQCALLSLHAIKQGITPLMKHD